MDAVPRDDFRPIVEPILTVGPSFRRWSFALGAVVRAGVSGRPAAGQQVFTSRCAACHTLGGSGAIGPDLRASRRLDDPIALFTAMWNHAPRMEQEMQRAGVPWPRLAPGDGANLAAFLLAQRSSLILPTPAPAR